MENNYNNINNSAHIYKSILTKIGEKVSVNTFQYHEKSDKLAVIIDPRFDPLMEGVIKNFMYFMNPCGWNLLIISYSGYVKEIKKKFPFAIVKSLEDESIFFDDNNVPNIHVDTYNNFLLNIDFWKGLKESTICIFQKDCIMYKMFPEYFEKYDFSGANYYRKEHCGFLYGGINGGFSIRNRNAMIECLEKIDWDKIVDYRREMLMKIIDEPKILPYLYTINEDVFFTIACEMLHKEVPDKLHRTFLSIEVDINFETCIYHGWHHNYHSAEIATFLLKKSDLFKNYMTNDSASAPTSEAEGSLPVRDRRDGEPRRCII